MATGKIPCYMNGTDTGWQTRVGTSNNDEVFVGTIYYRNVGNIVAFSAYHLKLKNALSDASINIASGMFASLKPIDYVTFPAGNSAKFGQISVNPTSGSILFYRAGTETWGTGDNINFTGFYLTAA